MFSSSKPYTAVTVDIDRLTGPGFEENDLSGLVELIEGIRIQSSGPTEAARALRKKLKYGGSHQQLRALTLLDGLLQNGGDRFQRAFVDEPLLERLRQLTRDVETVDPAVREKCNALYRQWGAQFKSTPGLTGIASLYKDLPKKSRLTANQSRVVRENERNLDEGDPFADGDDEEPPEAAAASSSTRKSSVAAMPAAASYSSSPKGQAWSHAPPISSKKDKKSKRKPFSLDKEKSNIMQAIAQSSVASTNLLNALKFVNRETTRVSESSDVMNRFEACKLLRRQILRYIQLIESDQWIGSLLSANDELVKALMAFEVMDKSVEDDSDSDTERPAAISTSPTHARKTSQVEQDLAGLSFAEQPPPKPPRPGAAGVSAPQTLQTRDASDQEADEDDDNDPFGDQHEVRT